MRTSSAQILAKALGVDKRSIENYAKEAILKKIEAKEGRDKYLPFGLMIFFHRKWHEALDKVKKSADTNKEQETYYKLRNHKYLMEMYKEANKLTSVEQTGLALSYVATLINTGMHQLANEIITILKGTIPKDDEDKIHNMFNEFLERFNKIDIKDKLIDDESLFNEDFNINLEE